MRKLTIDGFALGEVAVLLARQESVSISSYDPLNVSRRDVEEKTFGHFGLMIPYRQ